MIAIEVRGRNHLSQAQGVLLDVSLAPLTRCSSRFGILNLKIFLWFAGHGAASWQGAAASDRALRWKRGDHLAHSPDCECAASGQPLHGWADHFDMFARNDKPRPAPGKCAFSHGVTKAQGGLSASFRANNLCDWPARAQGDNAVPLSLRAFRPRSPSLGAQEGARASTATHPVPGYKRGVQLGARAAHSE